MVVVTPKDASTVVKKAKAMFAKEQEIFKSIQDGSFDRSWVDKFLTERGCEIID